MNLHPQARALLDQIEELGLPPLNELSPAQARVQAAVVNEFVGAGPAVAVVEDFTIPTSAGEIAARRYVPDDAAATILWIHGGGWVICDLDSHDAMCRLLANSSGARVIAIDYRRAPEHPFPAPLEDCWDALSWVASEHSGQPLILGGDSAGGNLCAVCALRARDRGGPELAMQVLVYPVTEYDLTKASYAQHGSGNETFLTTSEMAWFWNAYIPDPTERRHVEASPLRAADVSRLPPAILLTAEYDPLRDEGLEYAERLRAAGVPLSHHHYDDMIHAFFSLVNLLEPGTEAVAQVGGEIRAAVAARAAV
ncbi:MAG TPA: alpha/beta hydrolase [Solirubrobacteraceae bacterium]|nr:alpha/beta hydrolase [Solirubrobacteraceae bacterium]